MDEMTNIFGMFVILELKLHVLSLHLFYGRNYWYCFNFCITANEILFLLDLRKAVKYD